MKRLVATLLFLVAAPPAGAQWLSLATPGIPRTADGKPDLTGPVQRGADGHPDFTGLWRRTRISGDLATAASAQPWMRELMQTRADNLYRENPGFQCLPRGPGQHTSEGLFYRRIVQNPTVIAILHDDLTYRPVFMDGRALETNPQPTWMGYSVGHWDGDTLVVESNGFNDKTWLSGNGLSHTDALTVTERYRRTDFGHLQIDVTYTDPGAFDAPLHAVFDLEYAADDSMLETVCAEASAGQSHWVGTVTEVHSSAVIVAPELLAKNVGSYRGRYAGNLKTVEFVLDDGALYVQDVTRNPPRVLLVPRSDTVFQTPAVGYIFTREGDGMATQVAEVHVSGAYVLARLPEQQ